MWQVARFPIGDGVHLLVADEPIGVLVYGYDSYVSYGYPGGLNLNVVDPETGEAMMNEESMIDEMLGGMMEESNMNATDMGMSDEDSP